MFTAAVLVCSMQAGLCAAIDDEAGPYKTKTECVARLQEMVPVAATFLKSNEVEGPYRVLRATCTKVEAA